MTYSNEIDQHCMPFWGPCCSRECLTSGPMKVDFPEFEILVYNSKGCWVYQTSGMAKGNNGGSVELNMRSWKQSDDNILLLTATAYFHLIDKQLNVGHTVNFGKKWQETGQCTHGLLSLPYLDGPKYEMPNIESLKGTRFLWLIPITENELAYKKGKGLEALEELFESNHDNFLYMDHNRKSIV